MRQRDYDPDVASTTWEYEPAGLKPDWREIGALLAVFALFWFMVVSFAWWLFLR